MRLLTSVAVLFLATTAQAGQVLYDPASGLLPETPSWGWLYASQSDSGAVSSRSVDSSTGLTTLDTTANNDLRAGYSLLPTRLPVLDRSAGYTIEFDLRLISESHTRADRAGFSLIVLGSDRQGIELGFWTDRVWAQSASFTHAEESLLDTTATRRYALSTLGDSYQLFADGSLVLEGTLRDYSPFGLPYTLPNFLFLGDNTRSAQANVQIGQIRYLAQAIPEPSSLALAALPMLLLALILQRPTRKAP